MIDTLSKNNVSQTVTYPVRAGLAMNAITVLSELLKNTTHLNSTLTIWSATLDYVDVPQLLKLINEIGKDKIYLDVPDKLRDQLTTSSASSLTSSLMLVGTIIASIAMAKIF